MIVFAMAVLIFVGLGLHFCRALIMIRAIKLERLKSVFCTSIVFINEKSFICPVNEWKNTKNTQ